MEYAILSTNLVPPALPRLHSMISDFRPPSGTESGEAALWRLLVCRALGGYSPTSNDAALGWLAVFQSLRVARPQDASKAFYLGSSLSCATPSSLDVCKQRMLRPVSEVADMETWLGPAGRYVDAVIWHSRRHYVVYIRDMVRASPVVFVETAVETRWFLFRCQEGW